MPVFWTKLATPVRPKSLIATLAPVLPTQYSPIRPNSGDGNQGVYLASIPQGVFEIITGATSFDSRALASGRNSLTFQVVVEQLDDIVERRIGSDLSLDDTVKRSVILARRGQGRFRSNVEGIERSCRLTGITNPSLLIASHIKPWRLCNSAEERLDGMNGLLLTPDADLLFDRGFISFEDDGKVLVSPRADRADLVRLGFEQLVWERFGAAEAPRFGELRVSQNRDTRTWTITAPRSLSLSGVCENTPRKKSPPSRRALFVRRCFLPQRLVDEICSSSTPSRP